MRVLWFKGKNGSLIQPCVRCEIRPADDCGFLHYDIYNGDYDCEAPEGGWMDCCGCKYLLCTVCKKKGK